MKRLVFAFLFFVFSCAFLIWRTALLDQDSISFYKERAESQRQWASVLGPGRPLPDIRLWDGASDVDLRNLALGQWTLLLCAPALDESTQGYPLVLLERHRVRNLQLILVTPDGIESGRTEALGSTADFGQSLRLLSDARGELEALFNDVGQESFNSFSMVDPQGLIRFSVSNGLKPETMRQVVERYLLGMPTYSIDSQSVGYEPGSLLPQVDLQRLRDGSKRTLSEIQADGATLVFFQAYCSSCLMDPTLKIFSVLASQGTDFRAEGISVIFSKSHLLQDIGIFASFDQPWPEVYRAEDHVKEWEDPYNTIAKQSDSAMVVIAEDGRVKDSMPFEHWYRERIGSIEQ